MKNIIDKTKKPKKKKNMYFNNPLVEGLLRKYVQGGCTNIKLRDEIMSHAPELIRQVIRTHGLHITYGGGEESSFFDLFQVAWVQIEKTLYKFDHSKIFTLGYIDNNTLKKRRYKVRGCIKREYNDSFVIKITRDDVYTINGVETQFLIDDVKEILKDDIVSSRFDNTKVFNMWSQVAKTSVLAHIKKETRDKKNYSSYLAHQRHRPYERNTQFDRFIDEATNLCQHDEDELKIIEALKDVAQNDLEAAHNGLISKIIEKTEFSRAQVVGFFKKVRLLHGEFTDSPTNLEKNYIGNSGGSTRKYNLDGEEDW